MWSSLHMYQHKSYPMESSGSICPSLSSHTYLKMWRKYLGKDLPEINYNSCNINKVFFVGGQQANLLSLLVLVILVLDPSLMLLESVKEKMVGSLTYNFNASSIPKPTALHFITMPQKKSEWWFCWSKSITVLDFIHVDQVPYGLLHTTIWCRRSTWQAPKMRLGKDSTEEKEPFVIVYSFHPHCLLEETMYLKKPVLDDEMQVTVRWQAKAWAVCSLTWMEVLKIRN